MNTGARSFLISLLVVYSLSASAQLLSLSGVVTDAKTHAAVGQAEVTTVGGSANSDVTDSEGKFVLKLGATVKPGEIVELRVRKTGYATYARKVLVGELALTIELQPASSPARGHSRPPTEQGAKAIEAERLLVSESRALGKQVLDISKNGTIEQYDEIRDRAINHRERMTDGLAEAFPLQLQIIYHMVTAAEKCKPIGEDLIATADRYYRKHFFDNGKPRDALDIAVLGSAPDSSIPTVEGGFHELPDEVNVMLGKSGAHIGWWYVKATPWQPFRDAISMTMSIKNGNLLFTFEAQCEGVPIKVVNNVVRIGTDLTGYKLADYFQTSERAIELVDRNQEPVFQMIRRSPGTIQINGVFDTRETNRNGEQILLWASEETGMTHSAKRPAGFKLKPIFKYPAWRYPGIYADAPPLPATTVPLVGSITQGPGGVVSINQQGGITASQINVNGPLPPRLMWRQENLSPGVGVESAGGVSYGLGFPKPFHNNPGVDVIVSLDKPWPNVTLIAYCDVECDTEALDIRGDGGITHESSMFSPPDKRLAAVRIIQPAILPLGAVIHWEVRSASESQVTIKDVKLKPE